MTYTKYGPPEVVQLQDVPKPMPKAHQILVRVHATTVNRTDCGFRSANYFIVRFFSGLFRPRNKILGCEFAGQIETVGKDVTAFHPGDRVFGFDDSAFGGHAEYKVIAESGAFTTIPDGVSYSDAAPLMEGSHYALGNIRAAKVKNGANAMVYGATGAIGSAAVQLLKHFGAYVVAVSNTKNIELVKSLGADEVVDYTSQDFTKSDHHFDFIFDAVGKSSFRQCKPLLKKSGIYISTELGYLSQNPFLALITPLFGGKKVLFPIPTISKENVIFLKELASSGRFKPVIDRQYPFEQLIDAYRYVETGQKTGNVVITMV
ncbi:NAD(P)-dependent alcohol dehydrogenase [Parapedobacter sp. DT-150]|uniref:NAD(P)-dependent alcohol dehydrogenase n=1 Tax=Parapedobacter sp. DT-150 TaxID=3396162 RepID=UPI003F1D024E